MVSYIFESLPLYLDVTDINIPKQGIISLYLRGCFGLTIASPATLYIRGEDLFTEDISLYISGCRYNTNESITLYTTGQAVRNTYCDLFINGYGEEINESCDLFLCNTDHFDILKYLWLAIPSVSSAYGSLAAPLFINGGMYSCSAGLALILCNIYAGDDLPLYIRGAGSWRGGIPLSGNLWLWLQRDTSSREEFRPLFCKADDSGPNSWASLFVNGVSGTDVGSIPLITLSVSAPNSWLPLFLCSKMDPVLCTLAIPYSSLDKHGHLPLICCNKGGRPNTYMFLSITGTLGTIYHNTLTLVIHANLTDSIFTLCTHGY